jgi:hypothetical protein
MERLKDECGCSTKVRVDTYIQTTEYFASVSFRTVNDIATYLKRTAKTEMPLVPKRSMHLACKQSF